MEDDRFFMGGLRVSQQERAFLENLQQSGRHGPESKTLSNAEMEEKLEEIIRIHGEDEINRLKDRAREISLALKMDREFTRLESLISALLATGDSGILVSRLGAARALGAPYDPHRVLLFQDLFRELEAVHLPMHDEVNPSREAYRNFAFFESYFSNYIEGTVFELEDARQIIETGLPLPARNEDSHDILGTFRIVSDPGEMSRIPGNDDELLNLLKVRHQILLSAREAANPGMFKTRNNRAGNTVFVDKDLVKGTLQRGFGIYQAINHPFKRAAFMLFLVNEVHPFIDGNGRMARIMMNAELVAAGQSRILIPTVYRDDYLGALRRLTRHAHGGPFIRMLEKAWEFSLTVTGGDLDQMKERLDAAGAFLEPTEGQLRI
jgi:hypothetical protein